MSDIKCQRVYKVHTGKKKSNTEELKEYEANI
jgi:hypothetical protein